MIAIYRAAFVVSLLVLAVSLFLPEKRGIPIGDRLSRQPQSWDFTFSTPDHRLNGATEVRCKQMLLSYLIDHRFSDEAPFSGLTLPATVAAIFSFFAWRRERFFQRRTSVCRELGGGAPV
jgi:hypothetical protein